MALRKPGQQLPKPARPQSRTRQRRARPFLFLFPSKAEFRHTIPVCTNEIETSNDVPTACSARNAALDLSQARATTRVFHAARVKASDKVTSDRLSRTSAKPAENIRPMRRSSGRAYGPVAHDLRRLAKSL